jgi:hypothetical protein
MHDVAHTARAALTGTGDSAENSEKMLFDHKDEIRVLLGHQFQQRHPCGFRAHLHISKAWIRQSAWTGLRTVISVLIGFCC